jgi:PhoPQ-activated pathogenicity-related protein
MKIFFNRIILSMFLLYSVAQAQSVVPATALKHYLNNGDKTFRWEVKESYSLDDVTAYAVLLTSQKWREHVWTHQLTILVPKNIKYDGALLFITGGSINKEGMPNWNGQDDAGAKSFSLIAKQNNAIVAILKQTPNQLAIVISDG